MIWTATATCLATALWALRMYANKLAGIYLHHAAEAGLTGGKYENGWTDF